MSEYRDDEQLQRMKELESNVEHFRSEYSKAQAKVERFKNTEIKMGITIMVLAFLSVGAIIASIGYCQDLNDLRKEEKKREATAICASVGLNWEQCRSLVLTLDGVE